MINQQIKKVVRRHIQSVLDEKPVNCNTMVIGPTGIGKTYSIQKAIQELTDFYDIDIPFIEVDATSLTPAGYRGLSFNNAIFNKYVNIYQKYVAEGDYVKSVCEEFAEYAIERAIVYVDEIDKTARAANTGKEASYYNMVQSDLLTWLVPDTEVAIQNSGETMMRTISTTNMTFIFSGAFEHLYDHRKKVDIGFNKLEDKAMTEIDHGDLISAGLIKEFMYRIPYLIEMFPATREEVERIVKNDPAVNTYIKDFKVDININEMVDFIVNHPAGLRSMHLYLAQKDLELEDKIEYVRGDNE